MSAPTLSQRLVDVLTRPARTAWRAASYLRGMAKPREHRWSAMERAAVISLLAIVMGTLFVTSYTLALGDPVPHHIAAGLVSDPAVQAGPVDALQRVARGSLDFHRYASASAALQAIDEQHIYTALDLTSNRPTLYVASAAGASVARVLEQISAVDPAVRVVDTHSLGPADPNGVDTFYLMLVTTIIGFITVFQVRANAGALSRRQWTAFVVVLAVAASFAFTLVDGPAAAQARPAGAGELGHPRAAPLGGRVLHLADGHADRPLGDRAHVVVLRRARQQRVRRGRRAATASCPVRVRLAVAAVRRHRDSAAQRGLLPDLSARPAHRGPRGLGHGYLRVNAPGLTLPRQESRRPLSG